MALDPRIILSIGEGIDQNRARNIQQQQADTNSIEAQLRAAELQQRMQELRDAASRKNQPAAYDPKKADEELTYQMHLGDTVHGQLVAAQKNPAVWSVARQNIARLAGPQAIADLPEDWESAAPIVDTHIKSWDGQKAELKKNVHVINGALVDDSGSVIYQSPEKPTADPKVGTHVVAGALVDDTGKVIYRSPDKPASGPAGPKPKSVTSGDANKLADLNNSLRDLDVLSQTISGVKGATGPSAAVGAALPNFVTNITGIGTEAKEKQAMIDRVKQVIGKSLEGGVLRKEDEDKYKKILPVISDAPDVVTAKLSGLRDAIGRKRDEQLSALEDAGYDTSRFRAREQSPAAPKAPPAPSGTPKKVGRFTVEEVN